MIALLLAITGLGAALVFIGSVLYTTGKTGKEVLRLTEIPDVQLGYLISNQDLTLAHDRAVLMVKTGQLSHYLTIVGAVAVFFVIVIFKILEHESPNYPVTPLSIRLGIGAYCLFTILGCAHQWYDWWQLRALRKALSKKSIDAALAAAQTGGADPVSVQMIGHRLRSASGSMTKQNMVLLLFSLLTALAAVLAVSRVLFS